MRTELIHKVVLGVCAEVMFCHFPLSAIIRENVTDQVEVFGVLTPCCVVVGYHRFHPEDRGSMDLRNVGIPPQHYTVSQHRRPRLETPPPWRFEFGPTFARIMLGPNVTNFDAESKFRWDFSKLLAPVI
jgi:hypothetical protein